MGPWVLLVQGVHAVLCDWPLHVITASSFGALQEYRPEVCGFTTKLYVWFVPAGSVCELR
jgi:hypothetical protein